MLGYRLEQRLDIQSVHASCRLLELHRIAVIVRVSAAYLYRKPLYVLRVADYDALTGEEVRREKLSSDYYSPESDTYLRGVHER